MDRKKIEEAIRMLLIAVGEDPDREGLKDTPKRVGKMYEEILGQMDKDGSEHLSKKFDVEKSEIVIEKDIHFYSLCEHHMLPFFGNVHIAYLPKGKVFGLSKLARLVSVYAKRLQIQERMTEQIANAIDDNLENDGVMVVIEAEHLCMEMRGIKARGSKTICYATRGRFKTDERLREETIHLMGI
mgnify:CR=1 FL=1